MDFIVAKKTDIINVFQKPNKLELYYTMYGFLEKKVIDTNYDDAKELSVTVDLEILNLLTLNKTLFELDYESGIISIYCEENGYRFNVVNNQVILDTKRFDNSDSEKILLPDINTLTVLKQIDIKYVEIENDYLLATAGDILAYSDVAYDYEVTINKDILNMLIKSSKISSKVLYNGSNITIVENNHELICNTLNKQVKLPYAKQIEKATILAEGNVDLSDLANSINNLTINSKDYEDSQMILDFNSGVAMYSTKKIIGCTVPMTNDLSSQDYLANIELNIKDIQRILSAIKTSCKVRVYRNSIGFKIYDLWLILPYFS